MSWQERVCTLLNIIIKKILKKLLYGRTINQQRQHYPWIYLFSTPWLAHNAAKTEECKSIEEKTTMAGSEKSFTSAKYLSKIR